jgi:predicted  nucleic acid-binding Zn-ribbon protein
LPSDIPIYKEKVRQYLRNISLKIDKKLLIISPLADGADRLIVEVAIEEEINKLNEQRAEVSKLRSQIVAEIDPKILAFYEKIRRWAKDTAIVPIKKQACYGCYMKISDRIYAEVIRAQEIATCPHCGRILYKEDEEANE